MALILPYMHAYRYPFVRGSNNLTNSVVCLDSLYYQTCCDTSDLHNCRYSICTGMYLKFIEYLMFSGWNVLSICTGMYLKFIEYLMFSGWNVISLCTGMYLIFIEYLIFSGWNVFSLCTRTG